MNTVSCFIPGKDRVQVGADASGLELRCLGHYLAPFDGGKFAKEVVEGDIHTALAEIYKTSGRTGSRSLIAYDLWRRRYEA
jgi:DNA polymerase-1